jgi:hypothetical protein
MVLRRSASGHLRHQHIVQQNVQLSSRMIVTSPRIRRAYVKKRVTVATVSFLSSLFVEVKSALLPLYHLFSVLSFILFTS